MREGIIRVIKGNMPDNDFRKKYIAWLEAQGAKVSAIEGFETEFERQVSGLIASAINKEHEYNQGYVKWTANALLNYAKHELEKQDEQKSAWSERYIADVFEKVGLAKIAREQSNDSLTNALQDAMIELSKFTPQPKQEWSEEDEDNMMMIEDRLSDYLDYIREDTSLTKHQKNSMKEEVIGYVNWLKSLKDRVQSQPKQEWSEEDEQTFIKSVEALEDFGKFELADWLKEHKNQFLKPQNTWKPSDEHMVTLEYYMHTLVCNSYKETLFSLYQDLKKLREE